MTPLTPPRRLTLGALLGLALLSPVRAQDAGQTPVQEPSGLGLNWSAFGTIGVTHGDQPFTYQRFIRDRLTFERDTVLGAQADLQLAPQWSATVQVKLAPSDRDDHRWRLTPSWAFVTWRPDNDWMLRIGKLRVPFFLRSEHMDVGTTYVEARTPAEIYTVAPASDFTGMHLTRAFATENGEVSADAYFGDADMYKRSWVRDALASPVPGQPALVPAGANFRRGNVKVGGLVLTWREPTHTVRTGLHRLSIGADAEASVIQRPVWVEFAPGVGYWQTSNELPPYTGVPQVRRFEEWVLDAGADVHLSAGWRLSGELVRLQQRKTEMSGIDAWIASSTLSRSLGAFTPYGTLTVAHSTREGVDWSRRLDSTTVPAFVPGADLLNGSMRAAADYTLVYRQTSLAFGTSYALTPSSQLKFEWMHTRARQSQLIDVPAGEPLAQKRHVNVLSASYHFVF